MCIYKDSPYLERCIRSFKVQAIPSHIVICTSTPSSRIDRLARKYGLQAYVRQKKNNIKNDWNLAHFMAESGLVVIAHQDDMRHRDYSTGFLAAHKRYPDMTVFTTDYVIMKRRKLVTGDAMLWTKGILRMPLRFPQVSGRAWLEKLAFILGNPIYCPATTYRKAALGEPLVRSECSFAPNQDNLVRLAGEPGHFIYDERPLLYYRACEDATTKTCIGNNRQPEEEREMFCRF